MGSSASKVGALNGGKGAGTPQASIRSPSAAFGRLRIDSPRVSKKLKKPHSLYELSKLEGAAATERSPLVGRKLSTIESTVSSIAITSPPLVIWIGPALICALCYALYNIFIKKGSASIHPVLGGVILQLVAAILGAVLLSVLTCKDGVEDLNYDAAGIRWAIAAGLSVLLGLSNVVIPRVCTHLNFSFIFLRFGRGQCRNSFVHCFGDGCSGYAKYSDYYWRVGALWDCPGIYSFA